MGPAHSTNDIGVWLPEQKVMFAGDLAFSGGHPIFLEGSLAGFRSAAERMKALAPNALLPGPRSRLPRRRGRQGPRRPHRLRRLDRRTRPGVVRRRADAARGRDEGRRRSYADWPEGERVVCNLHRAYVELFPDYESPTPLIIPALWPEMVALNGGPIVSHA